MIESTHHLLWIFVMVFFRCICTYGTTICAPPTTSFCFPPLYCQLSLQPQVLSYKIFYVYCVQIFFIFHFFFWFNMDVLDIYLFQMSWIFISFFWWCVRLNSFFKNFKKVSTNPNASQTSQDNYIKNLLLNLNSSLYMFLLYWEIFLGVHVIFFVLFS